jgi:uncharacterized protein (TIGR00661 family)
MKIAYGVHGYGRGHAMRALAVLPELTRRHDVLVLAGGDAYAALLADYPIVRIPTFRYHYARGGKLSNWLNFKRNVGGALDLKLAGPASEMVAAAVGEFRPDVVVSDSEALTHRAAMRLRIPRITFDHFGLLVYCRPAMSAADRLVCRGNALAYRWLFGEPDRAIVSSFFEAPAVRAGVRVVGPVIRREVREVEPRRGEHLLVYLSMGEHEYTPRIERALLSLDCPVRVYGTPRRGVQENLRFKPLANQPFIEDLASCRAIFATAGNQLCGEVLYFGKPMLAMPIACLEQRLNAAQIERLGVGMQVPRGQVTGERLRRFLAREAEYAANARREFRDGAAEALEAIEAFAAELCGASGAERTTART